RRRVTCALVAHSLPLVRSRACVDIVFFVPSRRRHTISLCDWSSDVCSSDLVHEGQHFFSMDYVPGQNLAQIVRDGPLPADRAARYVQKIAEAIHYAHQSE